MDGYNNDFDTRPRWLRAAAIGLGAVVLAAAAFGAGRWSAPTSSGGQRTTVSSQSGPGPRRVENGVPVGYAHTPDGAVAAATNFHSVLAGPLNAHPDQYRAAIDVIASPEAKPRLHSDAERGFAAWQSVIGLISNAQQGHAVVFRTVPLAYHLDKYESGVAQVSIWSELLIGVDGVHPAQESWATQIYTVQWLAGDWKLASDDGGSEGPVPMVGQSPTTSSQLPPQLKEFKSYHYDTGT